MNERTNVDCFFMRQRIIAFEDYMTLLYWWTYNRGTIKLIVCVFERFCKLVKSHQNNRRHWNISVNLFWPPPLFFDLRPTNQNLRDSNGYSGVNYFRYYTGTRQCVAYIPDLFLSDFTTAKNNKFNLQICWICVFLASFLIKTMSVPITNPLLK